MTRSTFQLSIVAMLLVAVMAAAPPAAGQNMSYGQAYQDMLKTNPSIGIGANRYMYDKYYRSNPNVSPYLSGAILGGTDSGTGYTAVARPELEHRAKIQTQQSNYIAQRKLQGNVGYTANPGATFYGSPTSYQYGKPVPAARRNSGAYQNHWYGNWNK